MKRQKITVGSIVEIDLGEEYYIYGQILNMGQIVIFDSYNYRKLNEFEILLEKPVLFIISVYNSVITKGRW